MRFPRYPALLVLIALPQPPLTIPFPLPNRLRQAAPDAVESPWAARLRHEIFPTQHLWGSRESVLRMRYHGGRHHGGRRGLLIVPLGTVVIGRRAGLALARPAFRHRRGRRHLTALALALPLSRAVGAALGSIAGVVVDVALALALPGAAGRHQLEAEILLHVLSILGGGGVGVGSPLLADVGRRRALGAARPRGPAAALLAGVFAPPPAAAATGGTTATAAVLVAVVLVLAVLEEHLGLVLAQPVVDAGGGAQDKLAVGRAPRPAYSAGRLLGPVAVGRAGGAVAVGLRPGREAGRRRRGRPPLLQLPVVQPLVDLPDVVVDIVGGQERRRMLGVRRVGDGAVGARLQIGHELGSLGRRGGVVVMWHLTKQGFERLGVVCITPASACGVVDVGLGGVAIVGRGEAEVEALPQRDLRRLVDIQEKIEKAAASREKGESAMMRPPTAREGQWGNWVFLLYLDGQPGACLVSLQLLREQLFAIVHLVIKRDAHLAILLLP